MLFLIGVIIFILFIIFCYFYIKRKIVNYFGSNIKDIINNAKIEDEELPKSLSSMDSIYMEQIKKDFPNLNINELKRLCEKEILNIFNAIENQDDNLVKGKMKSLVNSKINDNKNSSVSYDDIKFHKTVVSKYENKSGVATITFGSSFQYIQRDNGNIKKVQDRARIEYIYVIDANKVESSKKALGLNCPNCGAPITSLGEKSCRYCSSSVVDLVKRVWTINDVSFY